MVRTDPEENELKIPTRTEEHTREKKGLSWWWLAPFALAIAAFPFVWRPIWRAAGLATAALDTPAVVAPASSQLGFSAKHEGTDWRLVWSRAALARLGAVGAMLTIRDGGADRLQFLSPRDLEAGAILYVSRTADLVFNLKVSVLDGPDIEEQIRVLGAGQSTEETELTTVPPRRIGDASRVDPPSAAGRQPVRQQPVRQFQAPPRTVEVPKPVMEGSVALPEIRLPAVSASVPQLPAPAPAAPPPVQTPPAPSPQNQSSAPVPAAPQPSTPLTGVVTRIDPAPIRTATAAWPRNVSRQSAVDVRIRVQIDTKGRVIGASPLQRTIGNFPFVDSALGAARMWLFSPALENGKPVPSESILTFKFAP